MRQVSTTELSNFKILPYDLYNESNQKILAAGEVITPGKLIMLKNYSKIYTEDMYNEDEEEKSDSNISQKNTAKKIVDYTYDSLDISDFETVVNRDSVIKNEVQIRIKYFMQKTIDLLLQGYFTEGLVKLKQLKAVMMADLFKILFKSHKGSQIRFMGEYEICHPLNVAIVAGLIAKRLEYPIPEVDQVVMAGLLHDIGKYKIKLKEESALLTTHEDLIEAHTTLGYELIKGELDLGDDIAKAALEHHENNDGSGYPHGLSSDYISEIAQIINVANYYDNLACNRTTSHVMSNRDALRAMLEVGTKRFSAKILYTFVHMFAYNDPKDFNEMVF